MPRPAFTVGFGGEESLDLVRVGFGFRIGHKSCYLLGRGRQSCQVQAEAAQKLGAVGFRGKSKTLLLELFAYKRI